MAINTRISGKIEEMAQGDENMLKFLRELVAYEANSSGRYTKEYEELLEKYAAREQEEAK